MESFDIFCFAGRILLGHGGNGGLPARQVVAGGFVDGCRPGYLYGFHCRDVGVAGTTAVADDGGETRLWYSFFLPVAGIITYIRWRYKWILSFSTVMSLVFICINLFKPEIHNKTLMPALAKSLVCTACDCLYVCLCDAGSGGRGGRRSELVRSRKTAIEPGVVNLCDNLVYVGTAFLTIGMLFGGALGRKKPGAITGAGDPKETWAAATWLGNLLYIHFRFQKNKQYRSALGILVFAFILLQVCWFGVNYLPSAQGNSVHVYNME